MRDSDWIRSCISDAALAYRASATNASANTTTSTTIMMMTTSQLLLLLLLLQLPLATFLDPSALILLSYVWVTAGSSTLTRPASLQA